MVGLIIRPSDLTTERTNPVPSEFMVVDNGVTVAKSKISDVVNSGRPVASQAEAEAGTDATKAMTPLTTKQAIIAQGDARFATIAQGALADTSVQPGDLAAVATSGAYADLIGAPPGLTDGDKGDITVSSSATVWEVNPDTSGVSLLSIAELQATTVRASTKALRVFGYATALDGGGHQRKRVASQPSHGGGVRSLDRFLPDGTVSAGNGGWWDVDEAASDIRYFGAATTATGATNAAAINSAFGHSTGLVTAPAGTFDVGATITTTAYRTLRGAGRYQTIFNKTFNGDLLALGTGSNLQDLALLGNGNTYTGRGVTIGTGTGAQWISRVRIENFNDYCVEYTAASAGTQGGLGEGCFLTRTNAGDVCVKYPNDASIAAPRYLIEPLVGGAYTLCDTNGSQNLFIIGGYCNNIIFGANAGKTLVWGTRIALVAGTMTVNGSDLIMDGCAIAGNVVWQAGAGSSFGPNNILSGTFTDNTNSGQVSKLHYIGTTFTPVWKGATTDPAIGNGTITGKISARGKHRNYSIELNMGSTTTYGTGVWHFPLKGSNEVAKSFAAGSVFALDAGTAFRVGVCYIAAGDNKIVMVSDNGANNWSSALPITWASGDYLKLSIDIELT